MSAEEGLVDEIKTPVNKKEVIAEKEDPNKKKRSNYLIIPAIYYTPETSVAFGISFLYYYRFKSQSLEERPSVIQPTFIYTIKNQLISILGAENYFKNETYHIYERLELSKYPDKYWGIGNKLPDNGEEAFSSLYGKIDFLAEMRVWNKLWVGVRYDFSDYTMMQTDDFKRYKDSDGYRIQGELKKGNVPGSTGGLFSGVGVALKFDTRDYTTYPTKGNFSSFTALHYFPYLGSDRTFYKFDIDIRQYVSIFPEYTLAFQWLTVFSQGDVPFEMMPKIGGKERMRGYDEGRYRDKNMSLVQAELRVPLFWRMGAVFFVSSGDVFNRFEDFSFYSLKYAGGAGIRIMIDRGERLNVRADMGITKDGVAFYFYVMEAF